MTLSSRGTRKRITKILQQAKKYIFCQSHKKLGVILIHLHQTAIIVLAVVILEFDNRGEKRSVPLTK